MSVNLHAAQLTLEAEAIELGAERYYAALNDAKPSLLRFSGAADLVQVIGSNLAAILQARVKALPKQPNPDDPAPMLEALHPAVWAAVVVNHVLSAPELLRGQPLVASALELVSVAIREADARIWEKQNDEAAWRVGFIRRTRTNRSYGRRVVEVMRSAGAETYRPLWGSDRMRLKLGALLLTDLVTASDGALELTTRWERGRRQWHLVLAERGAEHIATIAQQEAIARPAKLPMVVRPVDWTWKEDER